MNTVGTIPFSQNWNGKLDCDFFTTLRLANNNKYRVGDAYEITLKGIVFCHAKIVEVRYIVIEQVNDWIARLDTGYDAEACKTLIKTMYKNKQIDWRSQRLAYIMLEKPNPYSS